MTDRAEAARRRWRVQRLASGSSAFLLLTISTVRLGVIDHDWPAVIAVDVAGIAALPVVMTLLNRRDRESLEHAPAGTLFSGGMSARISQFEYQPRLARLLTPARFRTYGSGWIGGNLEISDVGLLVLPGRWAARGVGEVVIPWQEVESVDLTKIPAKLNGGGLDVALNDGTKLALEVRGYDRLGLVLRQLGRVS